jgi:hypothetical protein
MLKSRRDTLLREHVFAIFWSNPLLIWRRSYTGHLIKNVPKVGQ